MTDNQKTIELYKSRENFINDRLKKISKIMKDWKSNRIGRDYQTLKDIQNVLEGGE